MELAYGRYYIKCKAYYKKYEEHPILDDFSLEVKEGEVVVVVGPSGCGKSTLLRCINGLEPIQSGNIAIDGQGDNWQHEEFIIS